MGNNPSSNKPPSHTQQGHDPSRVKRDGKHPIPVPHSRAAAPPEPSAAQALGTTTSSSNASRGKPLQGGIGGRAGGSLDSSAASTPASSIQSASRPIDVQHKNQQQQQQQPPQQPPPQYEPSKPLAVPNNSHNQEGHAEPVSPFSDALDSANMAQHSSIQDLSYLTRPPRLPLPIEEEVHTPGSPILAATDIGEPVEDEYEARALARETSILSNETIDDDDPEMLNVDRSQPTVPTRLEWLQGGEKVYVTGTIFQWNRKTRLHPVEGRPGVFAATIHILPGTHHVRFLVDGQMQTSPDLPTTVDFGNNLVNYIEVSPDDVPSDAKAEDGDAVKDPKDQAVSRPGPEQTRGTARFREVEPVRDFNFALPKYLTDFDQPEDSPAYQNGVFAIDNLPAPPALPGFLSKPILNAATLLKDDNSVLTMPNHTVLNHLGTSTIRNNVLAVCDTTRYKSKYVTTIIYKPAAAEED